MHELKDKGVNLFLNFARKKLEMVKILFSGRILGLVRLFSKVVSRGFIIQRDKKISICDNINQEGRCSSLRRMPRGGVESQQWSDMMQILDLLVVHNGEDRWFWSPEVMGDFTVSETRAYIYKLTLPFGHALIRWSKLVPIKVNILVWKIAIDRIPTRENLDKKGMDVPNVLCGVCDLNFESTNHIFFRCELAKEVWLQLGRWSNLDPVVLDSYVDWKVWFEGLRLKMIHEDFLQVVLYTTWWHLWNFINKLYSPRRNRGRRIS